MEHVQEAHRLRPDELMLHGLDAAPNGAGIRLWRHPVAEGEALPKVTLMLTNPPFGTKKGRRAAHANRLHVLRVISSFAFFNTSTAD